jgi:2',3'-cyclic-nucleotide 2'-phosphodiesterase / 3'-nucleotidase
MMMMKVTRLFLVMLLFAQSMQAREISIHVAVTSDVHARLFPYDFILDRPVESSLAHVNYLLENVRARQSASLILLDNGDLLQGTPAAYYANFVQDEKYNMFSRVMNLMKYDAATIGNHDIEAGPEVYNRLKEEFKFPYLGANVLDTETGEPYFEPYTIIRRQGVRIAVLGLTTPAVPNWLPPHLWDGLMFQDMVEAARYWVGHIRDTENPDAIVGLFHSGMGSINPPADAHPLENACGYIARHVPGIDVIFTGHDHRERIEFITNIDGDEVLVLGPGHFAENLAVAELIFDRVDRRVYNLVDIKGELVATRNIAPSQTFFREFEKDMSEIIGYSIEPVAQLTGDMNANNALFGSAAIVDIIHDVQLQLTGADVSFTAPLIFNQTLKAGRLLVRDFFRLYEYENYLYTMELTGREILSFLEFSYGLWLNEKQGDQDPLLRFRTDSQGRMTSGNQSRFRLQYPFYSFDSAAGIRYVVDISKPVGQRVMITGMEDGRAFELDHTYRVAINSYRGSGGGGHLVEGAGIAHADLGNRIVATSDKDLRSAMIDYFRERGTINPESRNNWKIIPQSRLDERQEKDLQLLFD